MLFVCIIFIHLFIYFTYVSSVVICMQLPDFFFVIKFAKFKKNDNINK